MIYQAEFRFRREELERIKRAQSDLLNERLAQNLTYPEFDVDRPYNRV